MARPIRIVIAEDHPLVRASLAILLRAQDDFDVVGEAEDGVMAVELARQLQPDLMVIDYDMPRMNGREATQQITATFPQIRVVGFSWHDDEKISDAMRAAGAVGFVNKVGPAANLTDAIRAAVPPEDRPAAP